MRYRGIMKQCMLPVVSPVSGGTMFRILKAVVRVVILMLGVYLISLLIRQHRRPLRKDVRLATVPEPEPRPEDIVDVTYTEVPGDSGMEAVEQPAVAARGSR
jgi:hypothetical protein